MKNHVHQHVKAYQKCFVINPNISKEAPPLNGIQGPGKVWSLVGIDMIGLLQKANSNKYTATDDFFKWAEAIAVPNKCAKSVAMFFCTPLFAALAVRTL